MSSEVRQVFIGRMCQTITKPLKNYRKHKEVSVKCLNRLALKTNKQMHGKQTLESVIRKMQL